MTDIRVFDDLNQTAARAGHALLVKLRELLEKKSEVSISVTGGTLGIATLAALGKDPQLNQLDWNRVHIWWGDERFVAHGSADRNEGQAVQAVLGRLTTAKLHPMPSTDNFDSVQDATEAFAKEVGQFFKQHPVHFDITLLGMGPDGHVASLFPGRPNPPSGQLVVGIEDSPKPPPKRISFTYEAINQSDEIWFLIAGADKAEALSKSILETQTGLPAARVRGKEKTIWFVDKAAAELLS